MEGLGVGSMREFRHSTSSSHQEGTKDGDSLVVGSNGLQVTKGLTKYIRTVNKPIK